MAIFLNKVQTAGIIVKLRQFGLPLNKAGVKSTIFLHQPCFTRCHHLSSKDIVHKGKAGQPVTFRTTKSNGIKRQVRFVCIVPQAQGSVRSIYAHRPLNRVQQSPLSIYSLSCCCIAVSHDTCLL